MGTPHTISLEDRCWENWKWILKSTRKDIPKQSLSEDDIKALSEVCHHFQKLELQIPVLSVYEANKSKVRDNLLKSIRSGSSRELVCW